MVWTPKDVLIAPLLFTIVLSGFLVIMNDTYGFYSNNYDLEIDPRYNETLTSINTELSPSKDIGSDFAKRVETDKELTGPETESFKSSTIIGTLRLIFSEPKLIMTTINILSQEFGLPNWFTTPLFIIIGIVLAGVIITSIVKWRI